jgi:hypothetical protein
VLGLGIAGYLLHMPPAIAAIYGTWPGALTGVAGCAALLTNGASPRVCAGSSLPARP